MPANEYPSTMKVPGHNSSLYLVMKQMDLIKRKEDGTEYVVCKTARDANGDGKINRNESTPETAAISETIEAGYSHDRYGQVEHCINNDPLDIWAYYHRQLKYFDKNGVAEVAKALKGEVKSGLNSKELNLLSYRSTLDLAGIGMLYPDLVRDFVPELGSMLNYRQSWVMEAAINALGWIGSKDPVLVKDYVPHLKEMRDGGGIGVYVGERRTYLMWIACISLNQINQCYDGEFGDFEGCETQGEKSIGCGKDVFKAASE